jgi:hypothetical protein
VSRLVGEANDLVLDGRAVARAATFDPTSIHRRPTQPRANDLVRPLVGVGDVAGDLRLGDTVAPERERLGRIVARLNLEALVIDRSRVEPRAGTRLETPDAETQLGEMPA